MRDTICEIGDSLLGAFWVCWLGTALYGKGFPTWAEQLNKVETIIEMIALTFIWILIVWKREIDE